MEWLADSARACGVIDFLSQSEPWNELSKSREVEGIFCTVISDKWRTSALFEYFQDSPASPSDTSIIRAEMTMGHWWNGDSLIYSNRLEIEDRCNVRLSTTILTCNGLATNLSLHGEKLGLDGQHCAAQRAQWLHLNGVRNSIVAFSANISM